MTPREFAREQEAAKQRMQLDRERLMVLAWHTAAFSRTEKLPSLQTVMTRIRGGDRAQSLAEMKANLEVLSRMTGFPLREVKH